MDQVEIKNLAIYAFHGLMPEESKLGQRFYLDITCGLDLRPAGENDDYEKALCYDKMSALVQETAVTRRFNLIEALAWHIGKALLAEFAMLQSVSITVRKPGAPVAAILDHVSVTVHQSRSEA